MWVPEWEVEEQSFDNTKGISLLPCCASLLLIRVLYNAISMSVSKYFKAFYTVLLP